MAFRAELNAHLRYYRVRRFEESPGLMSPAEQNRSLGSQPKLIKKIVCIPYETLNRLINSLFIYEK